MWNTHEISMIIDYKTKLIALSIIKLFGSKDDDKIKLIIFYFYFLNY